MHIFFLIALTMASALFSAEAEEEVYEGRGGMPQPVYLEGVLATETRDLTAHVSRVFEQGTFLRDDEDFMGWVRERFPLAHQEALLRCVEKTEADHLVAVLMRARESFVRTNGVRMGEILLSLGRPSALRRLQETNDGLVQELLKTDVSEEAFKRRVGLMEGGDIAAYRWGIAEAAREIRRRGEQLPEACTVLWRESCEMREEAFATAGALIAEDKIRFFELAFREFYNWDFGGFSKGERRVQSLWKHLDNWRVDVEAQEGGERLFRDLNMLRANYAERRRRAEKNLKKIRSGKKEATERSCFKDLMNPKKTPKLSSAIDRLEEVCLECMSSSCEWASKLYKQNPEFCRTVDTLEKRMEGHKKAIRDAYAAFSGEWNQFQEMPLV